MRERHWRWSGAFSTVQDELLRPARREGDGVKEQEFSIIPTVLWIALASVVLSCLVSKDFTLNRISRASSCPA